MYKYGRTKVFKAEEVRKYLTLLIVKLKVFGLCVNYLICSLDFRCTETVVRADVLPNRCS